MSTVRIEHCPECGAMVGEGTLYDHVYREHRSYSLASDVGYLIECQEHEKRLLAALSAAQEEIRRLKAQVGARDGTLMLPTAQAKAEALETLRATLQGARDEAAAEGKTQYYSANTVLDWFHAVLDTEVKR